VLFPDWLIPEEAGLAVEPPEREVTDFDEELLLLGEYCPLLLLPAGKVIFLSDFEFEIVLTLPLPLFTLPLSY
jgi:hypothetical protein